MRDQWTLRRLIFLIAGSIFGYYLISQTAFLAILNKGFSPLLLGFILAYLLDNIVRLLTRFFRLPRPVAILATVVLIIVFIILILSLAIPRIINNIQELVASLSDVSYLDVENWVLSGIDNEYLIEVKSYVDEAVQNLIDSASSLVGGLFNSALIHLLNVTSRVMYFVVSLVIGIYILFDKKELIARIKRFTYAFFDERKAERLMSVTHTANGIFQRFVVGKLIDSTIIGLLCYLFLYLFAVPFALIISIVIGITNMIPYFGPFIGAVPAVLITLINSTEQTILVLVIIVILQQFDGLILGPIILGDRVGVSAFWIIVSVTVGGYLFGLVGMFLGVPVVVLVMTILEEEIQRRLNHKNMGKLEIDKLKVRKPLLERLVEMMRKA